MRVNTWKVGVVLTAAILLTGCTATAEEPAESKPSTDASEEAAAPTSDCPELSDGATVDISALSVCSSERMNDSAGYVATSTTLGMETTTRYDPANEAVEMNSTVGSMILIGDDAWVKTPSSEWQVADPNSTDPIVAALSAGAETAAAADPATAAAALTGEFTVSGTSERLGQKVFLVTGATEAEGVAVDATFEVTEDYVILATTTKTDMQGQAIESILEITDWDVAQDIVAPL